MTADTPSLAVLPPVLDLRAADSLLALVRRGLEGGKALHLDASAVEVMTVPCVQVMLAAGQAGDLRIVNPSEEFKAAFLDVALPELPYVAANEVLPATSAAPVTPVEPEEAPPPSDHTTLKILTIDDSKTIRDMLRLTLGDAGYEVLQAVDGQDGLDVLGDQDVDIVITDINMPRMDGYEVIRALRQKPQFKRTPILVLTTESETDKRNIAREAGATGWMVKPFDPSRLVDTVRKVTPPARAAGGAAS